MQGFVCYTSMVFIFTFAQLSEILLQNNKMQLPQFWLLLKKEKKNTENTNSPYCKVQSMCWKYWSGSNPGKPDHTSLSSVDRLCVPGRRPHAADMQRKGTRGNTPVPLLPSTPHVCRNQRSLLDSVFKAPSIPRTWLLGLHSRRPTHFCSQRSLSGSSSFSVVTSTAGVKLVPTVTLAAGFELVHGRLFELN